MLTKVIFSAALLGLSGCATMDRSDTGVRQAMAGFQEAFNKHDATALAALYTEDARLLPVNSPLMTGRAGVQGYWKVGFERGVTRIEKTPVDVLVIGDTAVEISNYVASFGERKVKGKDMLVWRRGNDGKWLISADIWNNDQP